MSYDCFIPIQTYPDVTPKPALSLGMTLAARMDARFHAAIHEVDIAPISNVLADLAINVSAMSAAVEARSKAAAGEMEQWLAGQAAQLRRPITVNRFRSRPEAMLDHYIVAARTHDLTILARPAAGMDMTGADDLIFAGGGPVLVISGDVQALRPDALRLAVAWDGSRAAARAVRDAMPILKAASEVAVIVIEDDKQIDSSSGSRLVDWLAHKGIAAQLLVRSRGNVPIGDTLQAAAITAEADMLVMGAFGHSRIREFILGGATRSILHHARLPILMSH